MHTTIGGWESRQGRRKKVVVNGIDCQKTEKRESGGWVKGGGGCRRRDVIGLKRMEEDGGVRGDGKVDCAVQEGRAILP